MRIIISPAKKMVGEEDTFPWRDLPRFLPQAKVLREYLRGLSYQGCRALWGCSDALAQPNFQQLHSLELERDLVPALFAYRGIQYQHMAPHVFTREALDYVQEHLRILSGLYGLLRPFDGVIPYRLEMGAKLPGFSHPTLYQFWGDRLAAALGEETGCLLDLASQEYSRAIVGRLPAGVRVVRCVFGQLRGDKVVEKATLAKMARGSMVRYLAERGAETPGEAAGFTALGFALDPGRSTADRLVFLQRTAGEG